MVMMEVLDSNPDNTVALDYILCSTLLLKDMDNFKRDYDRYCIATGKPRRQAPLSASPDDMACRHQRP